LKINKKMEHTQNTQNADGAEQTPPVHHTEPKQSSEHFEHLKHKKLYRSTTDKMFAGVCGGLAEYLHIDSNVLRLVWVLVVILTGFIPGVLVYIIALAIVPVKLPVG
jgi:phage shock protein C